MPQEALFDLQVSYPIQTIFISYLDSISNWPQDKMMKFCTHFHIHFLDRKCFCSNSTVFLFIRMQLTVSKHCFREWVDAIILNDLLSGDIMIICACQPLDGILMLWFYLYWILSFCHSPVQLKGLVRQGKVSQTKLCWIYAVCSFWKFVCIALTW